MPVVEGEFDRTDFDAVIVGSGFGGSVAAHHLAGRHGDGVCVLERGKAFPPGSFPRTPAGLARNFWDPSEGLQARDGPRRAARGCPCSGVQVPGPSRVRNEST